LDQLISVPQGAITVVAAPSGHGKTTLQLNLLTRMLKRYPDSSFAFFSYQESRWALALKLIMMEAGEVLDPAHNFGRYLAYFKEERYTKPAIERAISLYEEWTVSGRLRLSDQRLSAEDLSVAIEHLADQGSLGAVFVDQLEQVSDLLLGVAVRRDVAIIQGIPLGRHKHSQDGLQLDDLAEIRGVEDTALVLGLVNKARQKGDDSGVRVSSGRVELAIRVLKNRTGRADISAGLMLDLPVLRILDKASALSAEQRERGLEKWWSLTETHRG
jgi:hypothetical protein